MATLKQNRTNKWLSGIKVEGRKSCQGPVKLIQWVKIAHSFFGVFWSCEFSCSWLLLRMRSDGRYTLTVALVWGILGMIAKTFPWAGGGSGIVWSLVFHVEL